MRFDDFMKKCTACGGAWTSMLMSGVKEVAPDVWDAMPDRSYSFDEMCFIVNHLCYDRPHFRFNISLEGNVIEHTMDGKFLFREASEEERKMSLQEFDRVYNGLIPKDEETNLEEMSLE